MKEFYNKIICFMIANFRLNEFVNMKKFMLLISVFWSFSSNAQVELYNVGESGPSVFFSPLSPYVISFNYVSNGRLGIGAAINIPKNESLRTSVFSISYTLSKSNSTSKLSNLD